MNDQPPQLGSIPQHSEMSIPTLRSNDMDTNYGARSNQSTQNAKDTMYSSQVSILHSSQLWLLLITCLISIFMSSRDTYSFVDQLLQMLNQQWVQSKTTQQRRISVIL